MRFSDKVRKPACCHGLLHFENEIQVSAASPAVSDRNEILKFRTGRIGVLMSFAPCREKPLILLHFRCWPLVRLRMGGTGIQFFFVEQ